MEQLGIDPIHSIITEKCRNLAVFSKDLIDFKMELRPKIVFKNLNNFIVIAHSGELGTWMDGNLALAPRGRNCSLCHRLGDPIAATSV